MQQYTYFKDGRGRFQGTLTTQTFVRIDADQEKTNQGTKYEAPTAVGLHISVWVATPCYLLRSSRRYGGSKCLKLYDINTTKMESSGTS